MRIEAVLTGRLTSLISVPLVREYEAVLKQPEHLRISGLSAGQVDAFLNAICILGREVKFSFRWRPQLSDPGDEMVLETAVNGRADMIVSHNRRDFSAIGSAFGIAILSPGEAWERMRQK